MKAIKSLNIKEPIVTLQILDSGVLSVMDQSTTLRLVNTTTYTIAGGFKTNIKQERYLGQLMCMSQDGRFCSAVLPKTNKVALFSVAKKGLLYKVGRHQGHVESLCIDPKSRYIVTGGEDGKTFVWTLKNARLAFSLPPHADFVTALAFSRNGQFLASGSFDKSINIVNIATMKNIKPLRAHTKVITQMIFLNEQRLISADKEGSLIVWNTNTSKILKRLSKVPDDITSMQTSDDYKFLFVGTKLGYVLLYDLNSYELLSNRYVKTEGSVSAIAFIHKGYQLALGTSKGIVSFYSLFEDEVLLQELLDAKNFKVLYEMFECNPVLRYSNFYIQAETLWRTTLSQATKLLESHDKKAAIEVFTPFKEIPKKNTLIQALVNDFEFYKQFEMYINENKIPLAYSLALKYPTFKELSKYKNLEAHFQKLILKAHSLLSKKGGESAARELMAPFRGVSQKTKILQQLFTEHKVLALFKQLISKKEFKKAYILVGQHSFLKEFPSFNTLEAFGDTIYIQAQKSFSSGAYKQAITFATILLDFPLFHDDAQELLIEIKALEQFNNALRSDDKAKAYILMDRYPFLYETQEGEMLETMWNKDVNEAMVFANSGDIEGVSQSVNAYFSMEAKYVALATLFQQTYIEQLTQLLREKKPQALIEEGIRHYIRDFGLNEFIALFFESFSSVYETHLDIKSQTAGEITLWKPSMIVPYIYQ